MVGGLELSAPAKSMARGRVGEGKQRGNDEGSQKGRTESRSRPGKPWTARIDERRPTGAEVEDDPMAAMQGLRRSVARWGGRGHRGGASGLIGRARGGRWLRRQRTVVTAPLGFGRESETEEGERTRESERASRGSRGVLRATGRQAGMQEVAGAWPAHDEHAPLPSGAR